MCAGIVLWLTVVGDNGLYLAGRRMNWLVCNSHEGVAKEMFHYDSRNLASYNASETQLSRNTTLSRSEALKMFQV